MSKNKSKKAKEVTAVTEAVIEKPVTFVESVGKSAPAKVNKLEYDALNVELAKQKMITEEVAKNLETTTESYLKDMAKLQEEINFLKIENAEKTTLLQEVTEMFTKFSQEWAALKNKPFKRFTLAVSFVSQILAKLKEVAEKINTINQTFNN